MNIIFIKLISTLFISNYLVFAFLNLNMLAIGYTFLEYLKYIILCLILLLCIIPNKIFAITSSGGYTIDNYNINMVVNEDNTFDITEEITTYFDSARHRNIQKDTNNK